MDDYKDVQKLIEDMEREIKDLKCSHSIVTDIRMFTDWFSTQDMDTPVVITYEDGQNAIITDVYGDVNGLSTITNNQQRVFLKSDQYSQSSVFRVCSTRPILSITQ